ncbi:poly(ethylene terephthalate) hydrolase family protein [Saccharothrix sp. NRRL B-16348]|uniref:poly(ethylene terephthalate) hydrolase family protein n=1 Tax=Saccharothrix sp. NRRL B-16348 TaxID=1415542 RepID=UPI0006AFA7BD|nr:ricin-type beta-trefoil lectin domain protein [Saccharothrix sp. NRRL B-16348]
MGRLWRYGIALAAATVTVAALTVAGGTQQATGADNPYQRGPDPTPASVSANRGTFATAQVSVPAGNGFGGGVIYYPTDTSQGTFAAIAVVPGYTATWAAEGAWMGPWLASFGFVVIGIDTNSRNDWDNARGTQLLAALDYLTQRSSVRDRVDASRTAVMGHSMGGGGAANASLQRPSLKTAIGLAPASFSQNLTTTKVPTMLLSGQNDGTITPASVLSLYNGIPAGVEKAYLELAGAGHGFPTSNNPTMMRNIIPWFKVFTDSDTRYTQFLCPLSDWNGIRTYQSTCPLVPSTPPTTTSTTSTTTTTTTPGEPTSGTYVGQQSGRCLDVSGASQTNGAKLQLWDCHNQTNQQWSLTNAAELRVYGTKCLDLPPNSAAGTQAQIWDCNGAANQQWSYGSDGSIRHTQTGLCLDASNQATANGTRINSWTCNGQANQKWTRR